jgi:hypothetical protein
MTKSIRKAWLEAAPSTATAVSFQSAEDVIICLSGCEI